MDFFYLKLELNYTKVKSFEKLWQTFKNKSLWTHTGIVWFFFWLYFLTFCTLYKQIGISHHAIYCMYNNYSNYTMYILALNKMFKSQTSGSSKIIRIGKTGYSLVYSLMWHHAVVVVQVWGARAMAALLKARVAAHRRRQEWEDWAVRKHGSLQAACSNPR